MSVKPNVAEAGTVTDEAVASGSKGFDAAATTMNDSMAKAAVGFAEPRPK